MAIDDVSDLSRRVQYTSGAGQTAFTYPFRIFDEADLKVYVDDILQTLGIAYNVTGVDNDTGGSVVFLAGLSVGQIVTIYSDTELNRDTDYQQNGPWGSARLNSEFDKLMVIAQELRAKLARAIRGSVLGNTVAEMPSAADRASKYLWFNASGDPTVATGDPSQPITHRVYARYPLTGDTVIPVPADYTPGSYDLSVYLNGLKLVIGDDYAETSANSITLVVPATTGDVIEFDIGTVFDVTLAKAARTQQFITGVTGTTLTLTTISYTPGGNEIDVFMNGSRLAPADYTETNSTTITLASAANSSDEFMVIVGRVTDVLTASRSQIGAALYPRTDAETTAGVTPTDYSYPPGDVRRYGAVGDGVVDDTTAMQSWASVGGGHKLTAVTGQQYAVSGTIHLVSKTTAELYGAEFIQGAALVPLFQGAGVSDVTIKGGKYRGVGASTAFTDGAAGLIYFKDSGATRCSNVRVYDTEVLAASTGIAGVNVDGFWVQRNEVYDFFLYGILSSRCADFHIEHNNVHDSARTSRTGPAPYNSYGIMATGDDVGGDAVERCSISFNSIKNVRLWDGIMSHDCRSLIVSGNTIDDVRTGIDIGHADPTNVITDVVITGNTITLTTVDAHATLAASHGGINCIGASASARIARLAISNNIVHAFGNITGMTIGGDGAPITVENCDNFTVSGNIVSGVGSAVTAAGIYLVGTLNHGAINGNSLQGLMDAGGIRLAGVTSDEMSITGNVITQTNVANDAIYVTGSVIPEFVVSGNADNANNHFNSATSTLGKSYDLPSVASAASVTLPYGSDVFLITGTTNITSITATAMGGRTVTLVFAGVLTVTDGSNLKLAGNFTTTADDVMVLTCNGANWYEVSRSVN